MSTKINIALGMQWVHPAIDDMVHGCIWFPLICHFRRAEVVTVSQTMYPFIPYVSKLGYHIWHHGYVSIQFGFKLQFRFERLRPPKQGKETFFYEIGSFDNQKTEFSRLF